MAEIAWNQLQGRRESQQDRAVCLSWPNDHHLLLLADGMGGHACGAIASETVVDSFREAFIGLTDLPARERLLAALQESNYALFERSQAEPECSEMGTTLVAAAIDRDSLHWVSVGDSPLWLIRDGELQRLNEDHSVGAVLDRRADAGELTVEEAVGSTARSELVEAVQGADIERVDAPEGPTQLMAGDVVLLASDGVETCPRDEICDLASRDPTPHALVESVLQQVTERNRPNQDNATVIALRFTDEPSEESGETVQE